MERPEGGAEWSRGLTALRRGWPLVVLAAIGVAAVASIASVRTPDVERATGRLIVAPVSTDETAFSPDAVRVLTQPGVIGTLTELLENPGTLEAAANDAGVGAAALAHYRVTAEEVAGSLVVEVSVEGPDAAIADGLAASVMDEATTTFGQLYPVYQAQILDPVRAYAGRTTPSPVQYGVIGAVVGAAGAVVLLLALSSVVGRRPDGDGDGPGRPGSRPGEPHDAATGDGHSSLGMASRG